MSSAVYGLARHQVKILGLVLRPGDTSSAQSTASTLPPLPVTQSQYCESNACMTTQSRHSKRQAQGTSHTHQSIISISNRGWGLIAEGGGFGRPPPVRGVGSAAPPNDYPTPHRKRNSSGTAAHECGGVCGVEESMLLVVTLGPVLSGLKWRARLPHPVTWAPGTLLSTITSWTQVHSHVCSIMTVSSFCRLQLCSRLAVV